MDQATTPMDMSYEQAQELKLRTAAAILSKIYPNALQGKSLEQVLAAVDRGWSDGHLYMAMEWSCGLIWDDELCLWRLPEPNSEHYFRLHNHLIADLIKERDKKNAMSKIHLLGGMWISALITLAGQPRTDAFVGVLIAPLIASLILGLLNRFVQQ